MAKQDRREEMRQLLARRVSRGLTYRELAEESGVSANSLSWWAWKLRQEAEEPQAFVELELSDSPSAAMFEVEAPSGHVVRVRGDFEAQALQRLLQTLAAC